MKSINLLKKIIVESQIYVSLMGTLLVCFFMLVQNAYQFSVLLLIFVTFFSGYLYTKYQSTANFNKVLIFNVFVAFICLGIIYKNLSFIFFVKWSSIVFLGLLYNSFFLVKTIRKIPLIKIFYVGFIWALICSWLIVEWFNFPVFLIVFFYISSLVLPFDIRDSREKEIITFPKLIGVQNTKYLAYTLIFLSGFLSIFFLEFPYALAFFFSTIVAFIFIYFSKTSNKDSYFSFWVETCCGLPFLFLHLLKYF